MTQPFGETMTLNFYGPFKFTKGDKYLYHTEFVNSEGIYIWTIRDERNGRNLVHYIGETTSFGKRHREHLVEITGLNYRIIDADSAKQGIENRVWNGMWRDKSQDAVASLLDSYDEVSKRVIDYVQLISIHFAPTALESGLRKHVEGCFGWNLRSRYPHLKTFYPDDNFVGRYPKPIGRTLIVNLPEPIAGIDTEQAI